MTENYSWSGYTSNSGHRMGVSVPRFTAHQDKSAFTSALDSEFDKDVYISPNLQKVK